MSFVEVILDMAMKNANHQKKKTPVNKIVKEYTNEIETYTQKIEDYYLEIQILNTRIDLLKGSIHKWKTGGYDDIGEVKCPLH